MPKEKARKQPKSPSIDTLRHAEYYGMQEIFDDLYRRSKKGEVFTDLMEIILKRENILLAYRNIKYNSGSITPGTDNLNIKDIGKLSPEEVIEQVKRIVDGDRGWGYRPRPVRRKDIPKPNGKTRPLGIPCIWDRLIQQCIKQVMEPICEARFSENSYGFRPNRSVEHAIHRTYQMLQKSNLHYIIEFDIKGFFDNVNHPKLIRQIWAMGIRDKHLIWVIKQILKAPIKMPSGETIYPEKGTPQGGIISPLLANIVLNELDQWVESQWQDNPVVKKYSIGKNASGGEIRSNGYRAMRKTQLKEMFIVRYADDFRVFCRTRNQAERAKIAITQWITERLKLEVSQEKTRIVNAKRRYSEFLGFKIKVQPKGKKQVVQSRISDKAMERIRNKLVEQAKRIAKPSEGRTECSEIRIYNQMVEGIQNYYRLATRISKDGAKLNRAVMTVLTNRLGALKRGRLRKKGRPLTEHEKKRYGDSKMLRYVAGTDEPVYPIAYVRHTYPVARKYTICCYTEEGRREIHQSLRLNTKIMLLMMKQPTWLRSVEYTDNRISLYTAQWGKCAVTGKEFKTTEEIHCHHKIPVEAGGTDAYNNLTLVTAAVHKLIHAVDAETISRYMEVLKLKPSQKRKLNELRNVAGYAEIA